MAPGIAGSGSVTVAELQQRITQTPLDHATFAALGEAWQETGHLGEAIVAFERALQLKEYSAQRQLSESAARLLDLDVATRAPEGVLHLHGYAFARLGSRRTMAGFILEGRSLDGQATLKIHLNSSEGPAAITHEAHMLQFLNEQNPLAAPLLLGVGEVQRDQLPDSIDEEGRETVGDSGAESFSFLIHRFQKNDCGWGFADVALAMLELRACGIINASITADDIRYDVDTGVCSLADFSRAQRIPDELRFLPAREFFQELAKRMPVDDRESFGVTLQSIDRDGRWPEYFLGDAIDLSRVHAFVPQLTTGCAIRVYHTITERDFSIFGVRKLTTERQALLDLISFASGERVLDAGCAGGQVSAHLARRGCQVVAVDVDKRLMHGCRMLARIAGLDVEYHEVDFDYDDIPGIFDTTCALGLLPHLRRREEACEKIAAATRQRLIIEVGLEEDGYKWVNKGFVKLEPWTYEDLEALIVELERLFPGFAHERTVGVSDEDRYLFELSRKTTGEDV